MTEALETKHYVSATGEYLGGFGGVRRTTETPNPREVIAIDPETGEETRHIEYDPPTITVSEEWPDPPAGAVEVPSPPASPLDKWSGGKWVAPTAPVIAAHKAKQAAEIIGASPEIVALIEALAPRLSITPTALLADVVAKLAPK
jgi:hypothetical protein